MKEGSRLLKAAVKLAGGVFAVMLMMGITVNAKEVTVNSASEFLEAVEGAKNMTETLTVNVPAGSDFTVERFVRLYSNTVINAEGATIRNTNPTHALLAFEGGFAPSNVTINGGTWEAGGNSFIDLDGAADVTVKNAVANGTGDYLIIIRNGQKVIFEGCTMNGASILLEGGNGNTVRNCTISNSHNPQIPLINIKANDTVIDGNTITNSANTGIRIGENAQRAVITNNKIQSSYSIGIESKDGGNHIISKNEVSDSGFRGIQVTGDQDSLISENKLIRSASREGSNGEGLVVDDGSKGTVISGNTVEDTKGYRENVGNGIIVNRSENITVSDNTVSNSNNHGIQVSYEAKNVSVTGNRISNSGRMGISVSRGSQADLKNNTISNSAANGITFDGKDFDGKSGRVSGSIENCSITESGQQGIDIEYANASINGNTIRNSHRGGIGIKYNSEVTAENNRIYQDNEDSGNSGIFVAGDGKLTANGNIISNFSLYGIDAYGNDAVAAGTNNQVNISGKNFEGAAYRIYKNGMASNSLDSVEVGRTTASASARLGGCVSGAVVKGVKYEVVADDSGHFTVGYPDTDPAGVIIFTQDEQGNAVCVQAPINYSLSGAETPDTPDVPDNGNREEVEAFVNRIYTVALGRDADADGLKDWTDRLISGRETGAEVARGFIFSEEFTEKKLSDEQFVNTLYLTMFDRSADQGGKEGWLRDLYNGASREYVYRGFAESKEFKNLCDRFNIIQGKVELSQPRDQNIKLTEFVSRVYYIALKRDNLDEAGINDWCQRILNGANPADIVWGIVFSKEFTNRNLDDGQFVTVLYKTYFNREAANDPDGYNDWVGRLQNGASREDIVNGFSGSKEFGNLVKTFGL